MIVCLFEEMVLTLTNKKIKVTLLMWYQFIASFKHFSFWRSERKRSELFVRGIGVSQLWETPLGNDVWWISQSNPAASWDFYIFRFLSSFLVGGEGDWVRRTHKENKDIKMMDSVHLIPERDRVIFQRHGGWDTATTLNVNFIIDPLLPFCCFWRVAMVF